uniref:Multiple myeloma tumor-associated protein 2-like N-terminal domain-containing protein n=1 Tax=Oryza punctata TaxID=4537 RepID=A0A0E0LXY4_ORYPU
MYHPTRGGVRGGRDQFKWDDVKVDKHRENYLGHSIKAPVGRWQKGKDLFWYTKDKKSDSEDALKEEIRRVKEEEEQSMREALGLAPKRSSRPKGNRLDKHEYAELIKRGSTAEDLGAGHAEAAQVQGLGLYKGPCREEESSSLNLDPLEMVPAEQADPPPATKPEREDSDDDRRSKRRREEREGEKERKRERHSEGKERRRDKHEKRSRHESDDRSKRHRKDKQKRRHDSDSD